MKKSILVAALITSFNAIAADNKIVEGLKNPESVVVADGRIYVSEIGEFGKDGDGVITLVGSDGKAKPFATGMDDPKGLAYSKGALYVADNKRILKVGKDGKWSVFVAAEAFPVKPLFLNDLEFGKDGSLFVSDSGDLKGKGGAVYRVAPDGKVTTVINGEDPRVLAPNGLLVDGNDHLLMVDFVSSILYRVTIKTGKMDYLVEGFGGGDGLVRDKRGVVWISDWKNGRLFTYKKDGTQEWVKAQFQSAADIGVAADGRTILVPDMKAGTLTWFKN